MTPESPQPDHLLTTAQAAELLGVSPRTVLRLIERGELSAYRIAGVYRFDPADLRRYLAGHRVDATDQPARPGDIIALDTAGGTATDQPIRLAAVALQRIGEIEIDRMGGVLKNIAIISQGPATGHGFEIDATMVRQIVDQINAEPTGVRSRLSHPADADGVDKLVGRIKNARVDGRQARGDLQLGRYAKAAPTGDLARYILDIAEEDPSLIGISVVFRSAKPERGPNNVTLARSAGVEAADVVATPAANPSGLLSSNGDSAMPDKTPTPSDTSQQQANANTDAGAQPSQTQLNANAGDPVQLERQRVQTMYNIADSCHLDQSWAAQHVTAGTSEDEARRLALEAMATKYPPVSGLSGHVRVGDDGRTSLSEGMADAVAMAHGASFEQPHPRARELRGMSAVELARRFVEQMGVTTAGMSRAEVAQLAFNRSRLASAGVGDIALSHTTGDFGAILGNAANKRMRQRYEEASPTWRLWARRVEVPDFKEIKRPQLSAIPTPPTVLEGAEYTLAYIDDTQEVYSVSKYGFIAALTWESIVNDDLGAFMTMARDLGIAGARLEDDIVYGLITDNQTMSEDSTGLFHADHNNLNQGSGAAAMDINTIADMRSALALQRGPNTSKVNGETVQGPHLALRAAHLLVPVELQTQAEQIVASTVKPGATNNEPNFSFLRQLDVVGEPRLSADSTTAHYLLAPNTQIDTAEVAFLEGEGGPTVTQREGFDIDGTEYKLRTVVGARILDFRGFQRNDGS